MKHRGLAFDEITALVWDKIVLLEVRFFRDPSLHPFGCNLDWTT